MTDRLTRKVYRRTVHVSPGESRTVQSAANDLDINQIMARYRKTGALPPGLRAPMFGDFSRASDLQTALDTAQEALDQFETLPPAVRRAAGGSPVRLLEMLADASERAELVEAGLEVLDDQEVVEEPRSEAPAPTEAP